MAKVVRSLNERQKAFIAEVEAMSPSYAMHDKFRDAVRCMALALHGRMIVDKKALEENEAEYKTYVEKYGAAGMEHMAQAFATVADALEYKREDFLGNVLEGIGSANVGAGQFLTPQHVARLMAEIAMPPGEGAQHKVGEIIALNDPACGACVTMIEGAEELIQKQHVPQRDILIYAEDLDYNAFNMSYVQLSLLGYAARVTRMDSLSRTVYEGPWFTPGYFLHAMPMRLMARGRNVPDEATAEAKVEADAGAKGEVEREAKGEAETLTQGELGL